MLNPLISYKIRDYIYCISFCYCTKVKLNSSFFLLYHVLIESNIFKINQLLKGIYH